MERFDSQEYARFANRLGGIDVLILISDSNSLTELKAWFENSWRLCDISVYNWSTSSEVFHKVLL